MQQRDPFGFQPNDLFKSGRQRRRTPSRPSRPPTAPLEPETDEQALRAGVRLQADGRARKLLLDQLLKPLGNLIDRSVKEHSQAREVTRASAAALSLIYGLTPYVEAKQVTELDHLYRQGYVIQRVSNVRLVTFQELMPQSLRGISPETSRRMLLRIADLWEGNRQKSGAKTLKFKAEEWGRRKDQIPLGDILELLYDAVVANQVLVKL